MGTDIHICIQVLDHGLWAEIPYATTPPFDRVRNHDDEWARTRWQRFDSVAATGVAIMPYQFTSRNYDLFAILAGVRNGKGFADVETGSGWTSLALNRGWPADFDPEMVQPHPEYPEDGPRGMGDHSQTWVTLEELRAWDWDGEHALQYGVVSAATFERLEEAGTHPTTYSAEITGPNIVTYTPEQWKALQFQVHSRQALPARWPEDESIEVLLRDGRCVHPYVRMRWVETAREATNDWPGKILPLLEDIAAGRQLRLVLGFDS